jgi:hypothetical protein
MRKSLLSISFLMPAVALLGYSVEARADGSSQLGITQALQKSTTVYADIVDAAVERITWSGSGSVTVYNPSGTSLGTFTSGSNVVPTPGVNGAYRLVLSNDQTTSAAWDFGVSNAVDSRGRISSYAWKFNTGSFAATHASNASVYAVVPSGAGSTSVIELKMAGLAGNVYELSANRTGVVGGNGQSWPSAGHSTTAEFRLYLRPPSLATYASVTPGVSGFTFSGGATTSVFGTSMSCNQVVAGQSGGSFSFTTDTIGTYNLQCDLNGNGSFERLGGADLLLVGGSLAGYNTVAWDGKNNAGVPVPLGTYNCRVEIHAGEFHYVGQDIETSYQGFRLFEVKANMSRSGLTMFWDDTPVQSSEVTMPNGAPGRLSAGELGVAAGSYADSAVANVNSRAWGNFSSTSKGNNNFLDTYVWLAETVSAPVSIASVSGTLDSDGDGLSDFAEACTYGTLPNNPDTDGNGIPDGTQYGAGGTTGGQAGGLESNGRLATALAGRAVAHSRVRITPINETTLRLQGCTEDSCESADVPAESLKLLELAPKFGPKGSVARQASPTDLPNYTNALAAGGYDYVDAQGKRVGAVLILETKGELYEHSKAICDRAHGAWLTGVNTAPLRGGALVGATSMQQAQRTRDGSLSFIVYGASSQSDAYRVSSQWLLSSYPVPEREQQVLEVQVWASSPGDELVLAQEILSSLEKKGPVAFDADVVTPPVYAAHASTLGGRLELDLRGDRTQQAEIVATMRDESAREQRLSLGTFAPGATAHIQKDLPLFLDASIDLLVGGKIVDKVWLSDGAWVPFDAAMFGGTRGVTSFSFKDCVQDETSFAQGVANLALRKEQVRTRFSGCGSIVGAPGRSAGVARHFGNPVDVHERTGIVLHMSSNVPVRVCVESSTLSSFACKDLPSQAGWLKLAWADFDYTGDESAHPSHAMTILHATALNPTVESRVEVSGLATAQWEVPEASVGCAVAAKPSGALGGLWTGLLAVTIALGKRFGRRNRKSP